VDPTSGAPNEDKSGAGGKPSDQGKGRKKSDSSARDAMPPLTISESRRNIGNMILDTIVS